MDSPPRTSSKLNCPTSTPSSSSVPYSPPSTRNSRDVYGDQSLTFLTSPPPRTTKLVISITYFLKLESGTLDYKVTFTPISFLNSFPNILPRNRNPITIHKPLSMNILSWNVRWAARSNFRRVFRQLITNHNPDIVILTETRVSGERASNIISTLGFECYTKVDAMGFAEGIWVLWNSNDVYMEPISSSFQEIHLECKVNDVFFLLSTIYASPNFERRKQLWTSFMNLPTNFNSSWLLIRDFNDIADPAEKFGGDPPSFTKMYFFNSFLNTCRLVELGFIGPKFTWTNGRSLNHLIKTRRQSACHHWLSDSLFWFQSLSLAWTSLWSLSYSS